MPMETSHIWLGQFPSEANLDTYFEETYDDDDESPINRFAEDQGVGSYDHDWVERSFNNDGDLNTLIKDHSYSTDYIDDVIAFAIAHGIDGANTFIMADHLEVPDPKSCKKEDYKVWYVGKFKCST